MKTSAVRGNKESFKEVKITGHNKKNRPKHEHNLFETLLVKMCQDKLEHTSEYNSMLPSFEHVANKRRRKKEK